MRSHEMKFRFFHECNIREQENLKRENVNEDCSVLFACKSAT